jgi:3-isopropylmalate/(R)-2-methylmalate dehydratase small subunit
MRPVRRITGRVAVLNRADVDTDQIIPKQFLKRIERTGFGEFLFYDWAKDPDFELNRPEAQGAKILLAGRNFGCGSSREHAAWALQERGFEAIVAPSFGDIFRSNSVKIGLLPVVLPQGQLKELMTWVGVGGSNGPGMPGPYSPPANPAELTVDLEAQTVGPFSFEFDPFERHCLLNGLDDIARALAHEAAIAAFEARRPSPVATTAL